jgi:hypothetical protein
MNAYLKLSHAIIRSEFILSNKAVPSFLKRKYFTRIQELEILILGVEGKINPDKLRAAIEEVLAIRFSMDIALSCTQCDALRECDQIAELVDSISKADNPQIVARGVCTKFVLDAGAIADLQNDKKVVNQLASRYELNVATVLKQLDSTIARMEAQLVATKMDEFRGISRRKYA